jgi:hypothetical protein
MGVRSIWILVDSIDEAPGLSTPEEIYDAISNLLLSLPVMEYRQEFDQLICFKVFLTKPDVMKPLLKDGNFRFDRVKTDEIRWKRKDLDRCLKKRLAFFSNNMC